MATDPTGRISHLPEMHRGFSMKLAVKVATTANITLSGTQTIDGVAVAAGDRVLVKNQSTGSQNGIYNCAAGAWTRAFDMDQDGTTAVPAEEVYGALILVVQGTTNAGTLWYCTNTGTITLGSTALTFSQMSGGSTSFGTPALTLGTSNSAGSASTAIRTDATIAAFDATAPTTQAFGDSAATGSAAVAARRDHKHAMPTAAITTSGLTQASGKLLGRSTASTGAVEEITVGTGLSLSGGSLTATGGASSLEVAEADGTPDVTGVTKIVVSNGTLTDDGSGQVTLDLTGGGGGSGNVSAPSAVSVDKGAIYLFTRKSATNTEDDLFDASSLDAKWLAYTGYDATVNLTALPGWCKFTGAGAKLQAVPAGDWTIETELFWPDYPSASFQDSGLIVTNGTTRASATEMRFGIGGNNGATSWRMVHEKFVNGSFSTSYGSNFTGWLPVAGISMKLRLVKSGTNYTAQFSTVGTLSGGESPSWQQWQGAQAAGFTATHFGIVTGDVPCYFNGFYRY